MKSKMDQYTAMQIPEPQPADSGDDSWLTAQAVMDATGISKEDLIQFIQLNVLPKSLMRVLPVGRDATRKKSYFSKTILGHVAMLKLLRDEGHPVKTIAEELAQSDTPAHGAVKRPSPATTPGRPVSEKETDAAMPVHFPFPAGAIAGSAFFVNQEMRIGWVKVARDDCLFRTIQSEMNDDPSGTVFDILLRASLKELVFNWQPLFSFIFRFLEDITPPETFKHAAPMVSFHLEGLRHPRKFMTRPPKGRPRIDSCPIHLENAKGRMQAMRLYALALSEGALFIFEEERWPDFHADTATAQILSAPQAVGEPVDSKTPFSVISARLDNAQRLVDTLLPEAYYELINRIWDASDRIVESYGANGPNTAVRKCSISFPGRPQRIRPLTPSAVPSSSGKRCIKSSRL